MDWLKLFQGNPEHWTPRQPERPDVWEWLWDIIWDLLQIMPTLTLYGLPGAVVGVFVANYWQLYFPLTIWAGFVVSIIVSPLLHSWFENKSKKW